MAMHKFMSTKWPLTSVLAELSEQLRRRQLELHLSWIRRDRNSEADAITNEDFSAFSPENRIHVDPTKIPWIVLPKIMEWSKQIYEHTEQSRVNKEKTKFINVGTWKRKKVSAAKRLRTTDPW